MPNPPLSRDELARRTNLADLVEAPLARQEQGALRPGPGEPDPIPPKRSTTDPFESNFGDVDVVEGFGKAGVKPWVRAFAWIFLAGPGIGFAGFGVMSVLDDVARNPQTPGNIAAEVGLFLACIVAAAFWPYILLRRK